MLPAVRCTSGAAMRQGPHQAAQKSTNTGTRESRITSSKSCGSASIGSPTAGSSALHAPQRPVSARFATGTRFVLPHEAHFLSAASWRRSSFWTSLIGFHPNGRGARRPSESRAQVELPDPVLLRAVERLDVIDLDHGVPEHVEPEPSAHAGHDPALVGRAQPALEAHALTAVPGHARVGEGEQLDGQWAVEAARAEGAEQREAQLQVAHEDAAAEELVEHRAADRRHLALRGLEGVEVVPADQVRITEVERLQPDVFATRSVAAVVQHAG